MGSLLIHVPESCHSRNYAPTYTTRDCLQPETLVVFPLHAVSEPFDEHV